MISKEWCIMKNATFIIVFTFSLFVVADTVTVEYSKVKGEYGYITTSVNTWSGFMVWTPDSLIGNNLRTLVESPEKLSFNPRTWKWDKITGVYVMFIMFILLMWGITGILIKVYENIYLPTMESSKRNKHPSEMVLDVKEEVRKFS